MISKLTSSQHLTDKHWSYRSADSIKYIIPHHMAGKLSGEGCAKYFVNNGLENSANYCIGYDGDISCNVLEEYGAWTSSFGIADRQAITIEVSDTAYGDWRIPQKAQDALVDLCVDLFRRYPSLGGKAIYDPNDAPIVAKAKVNGTTFTTKGNILLHKWTSNYSTSCPEWHMIQILPNLVERINQKLGEIMPEPVESDIVELAQEVIDGKWGNEPQRSKELKKQGYDYDAIKNQVDKMLAKDGYKVSHETLCNTLPVIKKGSSGECVKLVQNWLKEAGYYTASVDGECGDITVASIIKFQSNINKVYGSMGADGAWGKKCWNYIL